MKVRTTAAFDFVSGKIGSENYSSSFSWSTSSAGLLVAMSSISGSSSSAAGSRAAASGRRVTGETQSAGAAIHVVHIEIVAQEGHTVE